MLAYRGLRNCTISQILECGSACTICKCVQCGLIFFFEGGNKINFSRFVLFFQWANIIGLYVLLLCLPVGYSVYYTCLQWFVCYTRVCIWNTKKGRVMLFYEKTDIFPVNNFPYLCSIIQIPPFLRGILIYKEGWRD